MGLSRSLPRSSTQIQAWPVHQTRPKSRCRSPASGSANVSSRWCEQGPSEALSFPLLPSRLEARLLNSVLSVSFSVESPFLYFSTLASQSRLPSLSRQNHLLIRVDRRLDVQAASPTAPKKADSTCRQPPSSQKCRHNVQAGSASLPADPTLCLLRSLASKTRVRLESDCFHTLNLFTKPSFARFEATPSSPRKPECFPNSALFLSSFSFVRSLPHTSTPLSAKPTNSSPSEAAKLLPLVSLPLFGHTLSADWAGPRPGWGGRRGSSRIYKPGVGAVVRAVAWDPKGPEFKPCWDTEFIYIYTKSKTPEG